MLEVPPSPHPTDERGKEEARYGGETPPRVSQKLGVKVKSWVRNMKAVGKSKQALPQPSTINFSWGRSPSQRKRRAGARPTAGVMINYFI